MGALPPARIKPLSNINKTSCFMFSDRMQLSECTIFPQAVVRRLQLTKLMLLTAGKCDLVDSMNNFIASFLATWPVSK